MEIVDTHCHLEPGYYKDGVDAVVNRARAAHVTRLICIGASDSLESARGAVALAESEPDIWATVGIHPHDVEKMTDDMWDALESLSTSPRVVAIGETGLDYYYDHAPREKQQVAYRRFIDMAKRRNLPIISHIRDAHPDAHVILKEQGADAVGGIIHCFTGGVAEARTYLDFGHYISFSGIVTFKNAEPIHEAVRFTPLDRILVETDSPYLAPVPYRGKKNEPAYVVETLKKVAALKDISVEEAARITTENAQTILKLSPAQPAEEV